VKNEKGSLAPLSLSRVTKHINQTNITSTTEVPLYGEAPIGNAYVDALLADSDIFRRNTCCTQGGSKDYLKCAAHNKSILAYTGRESLEQLGKCVLHLLPEFIVVFYFLLKLRERPSLCCKSRNAHHPECT